MAIRNIKNNLGQLNEAREALLHRTADTLAAGSSLLTETKLKLDGVSREIQGVFHQLKAYEKALGEATPEHRPIEASILPRGYEQELREHCLYNHSTFDPNATEILVGAHYIPQALKDEICFNQIVPWWLLNKLSKPIEAKNGGLIFACPAYRWVPNRRATAHAVAGEVCGPAYWVPEPHRFVEWPSFALSADECWPKLRDPWCDSEMTLANLRKYVVEVLELTGRFTVDLIPRVFGDRAPRFYLTFENDTEAVFAKLSLGQFDLLIYKPFTIIQQ